MRELPLDSFHINKCGRNGRHNECKQCRSDSRRLLDKERPVSGRKCCRKCRVSKSVKKFYSDRTSQDGLQSYCKDCQIEMTNLWTDTLDGYMSRLYSEVKRKQGYEHVSKEDLIQLYISQDGKCAITGRKLTHNSQRNSDWNIAVNKEDGHDDIRLVGSVINRMKSNMGISEFIDICRCVVGVKLT